MSMEQFESEELTRLRNIQKTVLIEKTNTDTEKSEIIQLSQGLYKEVLQLEKEGNTTFLQKITDLAKVMENVSNVHNDKSKVLSNFSKLNAKMINREVYLIKLNEKISKVVQNPTAEKIEEALKDVAYEDKMIVNMDKLFKEANKEFLRIINDNKSELANVNNYIKNKVKQTLKQLNKKKKSYKSNKALLNRLLGLANDLVNKLKNSEKRLINAEKDLVRVSYVFERHLTAIDNEKKRLLELEKSLASRESKVKYYTEDLMKRIRGAEYNTADLIKYCKEEVSGLKKEELVVQKEFIGVRQLALRFLNSPVGKLRIKNVKLKQIGQEDEKAYGNYTYELHEIMKMVEKQEYIKLGYIKTAFSTSNDFFKILKNARDIKTFIEQFRNASKNDTKDVVHIYLEKFINLEKVFEKLKPNENRDKLKIKNALMYAINVNAEQMKLLEKIIKTLKLYIEKKYKDRPKAKKLIDQLIIESEEIFELLRNSTRFIAKLNKYIVKDLINISKEMSVISKEMYEIKKELAKELQSTG